MASDSKTLSCDDYHVAWICAVADLELLPAYLMLDEEHKVPPYDVRYDSNAYTCGSINNHNVVIATCSRGQTGNVNAGRLSQALFKTFRNIQIALLVGIGGGIPPPIDHKDASRNLHLGDVVMGWSGNRTPSCIHHERGRARGGGHFELVGTMKKPDRELTRALAKLAADYERNRVDFARHNSKLRAYEPKTTFDHPGLEHDRLFKAKYRHAGGERSACTSCNKTELVPRVKRSETSVSKLIYHHGRIATGGAVIKDAERRDEIGLICDGAICVEMEAAGVDVNRQCLVIRGISDYSDSHKSDIWQPYAAGRAAVFARELLFRL